MEYGLTPAELARTSLTGQQIHLLNPLVASTYLLAGLAGVGLGDYQRFTVRWALGSCAVFMVTCLLLDVFLVQGLTQPVSSGGDALLLVEMRRAIRGANARLA